MHRTLVGGQFNNYADKILSFFDHLPTYLPTYLFTYLHMDIFHLNAEIDWHFQTTPSSLFVHEVVF